VTRRAGASPAALVAPGELLVPVPERGMDREAVLVAAEKRFQAASRLEQQSAPDYYLLTNSCQQFLSAVLGAGGPIPDHYFPKYFVTRYLERYRASQVSKRRAAPAQGKAASPGAAPWESTLARHGP
ncbi:MAG: hypothetical protein O7A08_03025, partial [SAR324 cluster bacterium]|nr:hypothetical protein [SAR324 cluster bacterium]